jgi:hypothetical protein
MQVSRLGRGVRPCGAALGLVLEAAKDPLCSLGRWMVLTERGLKNGQGAFESCLALSDLAEVTQDGAKVDEVIGHFGVVKAGGPLPQSDALFEPCSRFGEITEVMQNRA